MSSFRTSDQIRYGTFQKSSNTEREKRNLSQQEISDKLGVSKMLVSNWESGQRRMYAATLKKYCEILGISISYVLDQC